MPERDLGIHGCFLEIYRTSLAAQCGRWARTLPGLVADDHAAERSALDSIAHSLAQLGVHDDECEDYLSAELLALRGWAGIVRQIEERPDRVPARDLTVTLRGYLAVRLLFERAALDEAARQLSFGGPVSALRDWLRNQLPVASPPTAIERAWPLFHVAQLCGLDPSIVEQWTPRHVGELESELRRLDGVRRRRILHQAFERAIRHRLYDALVHHTPHAPAGPPAFQAIFCIDEREESFRRHLEEVEPACETFSTAGFFNVAMYHEGVTDAHPRPLCPVAIRPEHYVAEIEAGGDRLMQRTRRLHRRAAGFLGYNVHLGSRLPMRGAVLMTAFGWLALVPLVLRVVFPWLSSRWRRIHQTPFSASRTRLQLDREDEAPPIGRYSGFTVREMADIVRRVIEDIGIRDRLSPLVLVIGHGSISLNNPHESAHDCGACGGGRGGPNARAFAQMANDPRVRQLLAAEGLSIDATTWFVGGQRNTCNNEVTFFDDDLVPEASRPLFERAVDAIETTTASRGARTVPPVRWRPALVSAGGGARPRAGARRRSGAAASRVRACDERVLHRRPADANTRIVPRPAGVPRLVRSVARRRRRDPRAHHGRRRARRRRDQPRVLLQLRRSDRIRLRHEAAAQRDVAAWRHGWCAERSADRSSLADGRDPRAHPAGDRGGGHSRSPPACRGGQPDHRTARAKPLDLARLPRCGVRHVVGAPRHRLRGAHARTRPGGGRG